MRKLHLVAVSMLVAGGPSAASAAVLCVRPTGGACHATINAAVFAAAPGDTIRVFAGVYKENVDLYRERLRLVGSGPRATIIDAPVPMLTGAPLTIGAHRVEVASLAVRTGAGDGIFVRGVSGVTIRNVRVFGTHFGAAVKGDVLATTLSVLGSELVGGFAGVSLTGSNHGATVRGNTIRQAQVGIEILANDVLVAANRISSFRSYGIRVEGVRADIRDNVVENGLQPVTALSVIGDDPKVLRNRVVNAGPLWVRCLACATAQVTRNVVVGSATAGFESQVGLQATGDTAGLVLQGNQVSRAVRAAFLVEGTGVRAIANVALDTGQPSGGEGFLVRGPGGGHRLVRNTARRVGASGFRVEADDVTLEGNLSQGAGLNGFFIWGQGGVNSGMVLERNRALDSNAAGFALLNDPVGTVLRGNAAARNRYDLCGSGSGTDLSGNAFDSISDVCDVFE